MADAETVQVQPLTTYYEGSEHKSPASKPYAAPRWQANELVAQGFAKIVEEKPKAEADAPREDAADETASDGDARPRGRRGTLKV